MSKDEKEICLYCKWWHFYAAPGYEDLWKAQPGECRRRAPITDDHNDTLFPPMRGGDWCGEFEDRGDTWEHISRPAQRVIDGIEIE